MTIHDTPKDFFPEFVRATNVVLDRYSAKDAFFKQVLDSQRNFAKTVVPYWTKILDLYSNLGNAALATHVGRGAGRTLEVARRRSACAQPGLQCPVRAAPSDVPHGFHDSRASRARSTRSRAPAASPSRG